jgi:Ca2+-binding RTX toxin-like protein
MAIFNAGNGNDTLNGGDDNDIVNGGNGNDERICSHVLDAGATGFLSFPTSYP